MWSTGVSVGQRRFVFLLLIGTCLSWPAAVLLVSYTINTGYVRPAIYFALAVGLWNFVMLGIILYWVRVSSRVFYGGLELLFALALLAFTIFLPPHTDPAAARPVLIPLGEASQIFQICAALYVLVRGLDNLGQGLREYPVWNRRWRWLSLQSPAPPIGGIEER